MKKILSTLVVLAFLAGCAGAKKKSGDAGGSKSKAKTSGKKLTSKIKKTSREVKCTLDKDERILEILPGDGGGCEVEYTKWGKTKTIGTAQNDPGYCNGLLEKVQGNLETAGFTCK